MPYPQQDGSSAPQSRRSSSPSVLGILERLADRGTLELLDPPDSTGVVAAKLRMSGQQAYAYVTDGAVKGGALTAAGCDRIVHAIGHAQQDGRPVIGVWHSGGAALHEGVRSLDGVARVFTAITHASGSVPQISLVLGPAAGGAAYGPALTDVVVMGPEGKIFVTGPGVVRSVTGEDVTAEQLGGPAMHGRKSGVAHLTAESDDEAFELTRRVGQLLGTPGLVDFSKLGDDADPAEVLPDSARRAYDVRPLVDALLDEPALELQRRWAANVHTSLGRLAGHTVGIVASNPLHMGGCLDAAAGDKAARFVRMCDALGIPLLVLVDVPGYLPGVGQEREGVVRRGAKLLHAFAGSSVPRVTVVTRKAFGGAYIAMNSKGLGASTVLAWPTAEIGIMNARSAVQVLHRRELAAVPDGDARESLLQRLVADHIAHTGGLQRGVELGVVDAIVEPKETRRAVAEAIAAHPRRSGYQRNIPL
ncbi:MAG: acyl-CoA carboxylase subunit beta [Frankiaceae bacterium]